MSELLFGLVAALFLFVRRRRYLRRGLRARWGVYEQLGRSLTLAGVALFIASLSRGSASGFVASAIGLAGLAAYDAIETASFRYFGGPMATVSRNRPNAANLRATLALAGAYLRSYFPRRHFAIAIAAAAVALAAATRLRFGIGTAAAMAGTQIGVGAVVVFFATRPRVRQRRALSPAERRIADAWPVVDAVPLYRRERLGAFRLGEPPAPLPDGVLLVIVESAGRHLPSSDDPACLLARRLAELSGVADQWLFPANAVVAGSISDIPIPSLLTGAAPQESIEKLHRLPFVFDFAKARGYQTAFFTSTMMGWSNLDAFLAGARIDALFTAESSGMPCINDIGVDDYVAARGLERWLDGVDGRFFAVHYCNALHVPFQAESEFGVPSAIGDRRLRAIHIVEKQLALLFSQLARSGRLDRTLIVLVGDHGELVGEPPVGADANASRLCVLHDKVVRPLLMLKPPIDLPSELAETLRGNMDKLVAQFDIAPTLAHLMGATLADGLSYAGHSLLKPIPVDRIAYVLNTNEWRMLGRSAAAIFRGRSSAIVDYLDRRLCRWQNGAGPGETYERDELLRVAFEEPLVRKAMARVYKDKLGPA